MRMSKGALKAMYDYCEIMNYIRINRVEVEWWDGNPELDEWWDTVEKYAVKYAEVRGAKIVSPIHVRLGFELWNIMDGLSRWDCGKKRE